MLNAILSALLLAVPLIFSGAVHMWVVSKNLFPGLAGAINVSRFGQNKTWRGFIVMMLATIPGVYLALALQPILADYLLVDLHQANPIVLGVGLGFGYALLELPNSYVKRRLNINPGERSEKFTFLFSFIDQADSAVGCAIVYWLLLSPPLSVMIWIMLLGPLVHMIVNLTLYSLGLRKHAL